VRGKKLKRGYKVWPVGVDIAKAELYGWLRLRIKDGVAPPGYCHFPEYGEEYFQQLTAEHLVTTVNQKSRRTKMAWHVLPNRENHFLDARIYARAAASVLGIDQMAKAASKAPPATATAAPVATPDARREPAPAAPTEGRSRFWKKKPRGGGGSWFKPRR
jgi:phage terminase large subunit GpA-like protein